MRLNGKHIADYLPERSERRRLLADDVVANDKGFWRSLRRTDGVLGALKVLEVSKTPIENS